MRFAIQACTVRRAIAALCGVAWMMCAVVARAEAPAHVKVPLDVPAQELVFHNARMSLREGKPQDALKFWLVRNALKDQDKQPSHDAEFESVVWAAAGQAGLCPSGFPRDGHGAGLWPLATHNVLLKMSARPYPPEQPRTFLSFAAGRQQRRISLHDVLTHEEMQSVRFYPASCWLPYMLTPELGTLHVLDLQDRLSVGIMLRDLLVKALSTLDPQKVNADALIRLRLFDLELALTRLAKARARRDSSLLEQVARSTGVSETGIQLMRADALEEFYESQRAALLRDAPLWTASTWMSLSPARRNVTFAEVFERTRKAEGAADTVRTRTLPLLIETTTSLRDGAELMHWLSYVSSDADRRALAISSLGAQILALPPAAGFTERGALALWRGVDQLERGEQLMALQSFAYAIDQAPASADGETVHRLAKRWLTFVLAQYETTDEVLALLGAFLGRVDFAEALSVLLWRAAFAADTTSYERILGAKPKAGAPLRAQNTALSRTAEHLAPLGAGDAAAMWRRVESSYREQPHALYTFSKRLADQLSTESLDVRKRNLVTLALGEQVLERSKGSAPTALAKKIDVLRAQMASMREAIERVERGLGDREQALRPDAESYAGSIRLAPADPLPWPFTAQSASVPSPFSPLQLVPIEWRDARGALVYGWQVRE